MVVAGGREAEELRRGEKMHAGSDGGRVSLETNVQVWGLPLKTLLVTLATC